MINIGVAASDIISDVINNPMNHGIGAGLPNNQPTVNTRPITVSVPKNDTQQKNTIKAVSGQTKNSTIQQIGNAIKETGTVIVKDTINRQKQNVQRAATSNDIGSLLVTLIGANRQGATLSGIVDMTMKKSVDEMLQQQIKKGQISLQTSKLGKTYATAKAYYKKLYDGDKMMMDLRNKTEKNISNTINQAINKRLASWQNGMPQWQKLLLANSKLASSLRQYVNNVTQNCVRGIFSDSVLNSWNNAILNNVKKIKDAIKIQFQTTFKGGIEYVQKLKQAIADKIKLYQEMKARYEKHIASIINDYKEKITNAIKQFTDHLASTIGGSIKSMVAGIKL